LDVIGQTVEPSAQRGSDMLALSVSVDEPGRVKNHTDKKCKK
jgi:hypothetical protein